MNLTSDVTHEVLCLLPDFRSLAAAITVSKSFHDTFKSHPKSIVHSVAANVAGTALPYAARAAHYVNSCSSTDDRSPASVPDEEHFRGIAWELNRDMAASVEGYVQAVRTIGDFYSMRHKDRTSSSSVLDATETHRFARAMYRYILCYNIIFSGGFHKNDDHDAESDTSEEDHDEDEDEEETERQQIRAGLCEFLKALPSEELLELMDVCAFATDTRTWQLRAWCHIGVVYGSSNLMPVDVMVLARRFEQRSAIDRYEERTLDEFDPMSYAAREILCARKFPEDRIVAQGNIVASVRGVEDTCSRCYANCGLQLLGAPNMDLLAGLLTMPERAVLLPGLLPGNRDEACALIQHLRDVQHIVADSTLVGKMVDMELEGEDADDEHWSKDEWYCLDCIKLLFRQRLMLWWREEKQRIGAPPQDDCWYGYDCRTMTHRSSHATKLNHLCRPVRGFAPNRRLG